MHVNAGALCWLGIIIAKSKNQTKKAAAEMYATCNIAIIFALSTVAIVIVYFEIRKWFIKRRLRNFPSPKQYPIFGVALRFLGKSNDQIIDIISDIFAEVPTTPVQAWLGPAYLFIGIAAPHDVEIILNHFDCLNKPYFYEFLHCKSSIIASDRETWKADRRALTTAYDAKVLHSYLPFINIKSRILVQRFEPYVKTAGNLYRLIFIHTLDTIARTTMGTEMNMQTSAYGNYIYGIFKQIMESIQYRTVRFWLRWNWVYALTQVYRDERIPLIVGNRLIEDGYNAKKNELQLRQTVAKTADDNDTDSEKPTADIKNVLDKCIELELDGVFNHDNLMDQIRLVIFAGSDTLSVTVFCTLLLLAINQTHQDLVVDELRAILGDANRDVTHTHLTQMKYMERVIKESQRLLAPVPYIGRKSSEEIQLANGVIPKNTMILINIMHMHRDPKIWGKNVLEFVPDRFLPEQVTKRPAFSFIPFSAGPRNCIGMKYAMNSAKIVLAHLLRRYRFKTNLRFDQIKIKIHMVLDIMNDNPLEIEERDF